jgi:hypothetical protein
MRNPAIKNAFEALPGTVLSTKVGRMVFDALQRKEVTKRNTTRSAASSSSSAHRRGHEKPSG